MKLTIKNIYNQNKEARALSYLHWGENKDQLQFNIYKNGKRIDYYEFIKQLNYFPTSLMIKKIYSNKIVYLYETNALGFTYPISNFCITNKNIKNGLIPQKIYWNLGTFIYAKLKPKE